MISIRASKTPLAFLCPGSIQKAEVQLSEDSEPATVGRAAHEALRPLAEIGEIRWDEVQGIADRHGVPADEVRMLCAFAAKLWPSIASSFPDAITEVPLRLATDEIELTGTNDAMSISGTVARILDWKTGRKDSDYSHQMRAYAALALADNSDLAEVSCTVVWLRDGEIENYTVNRGAADEWVESLTSIAVRWDGVYHPGKHCQYCPRSHECVAANALARRDVAALLDKSAIDPSAELARMTPAEIIDLNGKADMVLRYAKRVHDAVKAYVAEHGDVIGDQVKLTLACEERRELEPMKAWPVIEDAGFGDVDFADCVKISVSKVEKRIAQKAGRGKGASAVRALSARLENAGAVVKNEVVKLVTKRA